MCFNATITTPLHIIVEEYRLEVLGELNYSQYGQNRIAFTHPFIPMISQGRKLSLGKWGLIPHWVNDCTKADDISKYTLNARVETITEKPSFKYSVNKGRVVIVFDGFFEWKHVGKQKIPYYVSSTNGKPLVMAGIVSQWRGIDTFSIITTQALGIMKEVHNSKERMPYFIHEDDMDTWLDSTIKYDDVIGEVSPIFEHLKATQRTPGE